MNKQELYDELCAVLTDYEGNGADTIPDAEDLYLMLVKIQNNWEFITAAE